ncbi:aldehyde-activating protein [Alteromonas aestuariivivens]|uniref:Aldehyde-activating protein n=1 Tax=Alteromonas aestuariivivens TaxID=1938339 RepID=A0A3D8MAA8_9ALTE|nr:GFA family protein [Alteromonas aestuariivivens]RDV26618.1 aldehyde-activating protein [Alteromonas aestuariivivens]
MNFKIHCQCGRVVFDVTGQPIVHATCHCSDCRTLLGVPFHAVTAWNRDDIILKEGQRFLSLFQHPTLNMQKHFCVNCAQVLFNTNSMGWRVLAQPLIEACLPEGLPEALSSDKHLFYDQRVVDINDELPKYLRGTSGPLYDATTS